MFIYYLKEIDFSKININKLNISFNEVQKYYNGLNPDFGGGMVPPPNILSC